MQHKSDEMHFYTCFVCQEERAFHEVEREFMNYEEIMTVKKEFAPSNLSANTDCRFFDGSNNRYSRTMFRSFVEEINDFI